MERVNKQIAYAKNFLVAATEVLDKGFATFPFPDYECPLSPKEPEPEPETEEETMPTEGQVDEEITPPPFINLPIAPGADETTGPPVFNLPMEPGPVILPEDESNEETTPPPFFNLPMEPGPVILPEEPVATAETTPEIIEKVVTDSIVDVDVSRIPVDFEKDEALDSGTEWRQKTKANLASRFETSKADNVDEKSASKSSSVSYVGMAIGLAVGAAVTVGLLALVYGVHRSRKGGKYEVGIVGEEELAQREENALQESGYENPAYKFFEEMDDGDDEEM